MRPSCAFVLLVSFTIATAIGTKRTYDRCANVDMERGVRIHWTVDEGVLYAAIEAETSGFVGVVVEGPLMDHRDAWLASYSSSKSDLCYNGCLLDAHWRNDNLVVDRQNDLDNAIVSIGENKIVAEFQRPLKTGDDYDVDISVDTPLKIQWLLHPSQGISGNGDSIPEATVKGSASIHFGEESSCTSIVARAAPITGSWKSGTFIANWVISADNQFIDFNFSAATNGWVSLGISTGNAMSDSDMYTGWVTSANQVVLLDTWSPDYNMPREDTSRGGTNNVITPTGSQSGGRTYLAFRRKLDTGDTNNDVKITNTNLYIMYAIGTNDGNTNNVYTKHTTYNTAPMNFYASSAATATGAGTTAGTPSSDIADIKGASYSTPNSDFKIDWAIQDDEILIKITCQTAGWVSFGIGNTDRMTNADMYTGWVDDNNGAITILDTWSPDYNRPAEDTSRGGTMDAVAVGGSQTDGVTVLAFKRKLKTGDTNDIDITDSFQNVLWAYAPADGSGNIYAEHTNYGSISLNLYTGAVGAAKVSAGVLLMILVTVTGAVAVAIRWGRRFYKDYQLKKELEQQEKEDKKDDPEPTKVDKRKSLAYQMADPRRSMYSRSYSTTPSLAYDHVMPTGKTYYRGSTLVKQKINFDDMEEAEKDSASDMKVEAEEIEAKSTGNAKVNILKSVIDYRIPYFNWSVYSVMLAIVFVAVNIGCIFITPSYSKNFGSLVAANSLLVTLPATRNSILVYLLGAPLDKTIMYHRWLGRWTFIVATIHIIWTMAEWGASITKERLKAPEHLCGLFAWFILIAMMVTSYEYFRRRKFEIFFYSHFIFIGFYILGCFHSANFIPFCIVAAILYLFDRFLRIVWGIVPMKTVQLTIKDAADNVVQVRFPKHKLAKLLGLYKVGQYVFVNFPGVSMLEWHPFSVSSGPDERTLEMHIRGMGNHTKYLVEHAKNNQQLWLRVDGPYGNLNFNYKRFPVLLLVAGGIGVTPVMGILKDLYNVGDLDPNEKRKPHAVENVYVVWAVQNKPQYDWFSIELNEIWSNSQKPGFPKLNVSIYVSKPSDDMDPSFFTGRPDLEQIFDGVLLNHPNKATNVFVCGPKPMVITCWDCSNMKSRKGNRFHFHHETFEF